MADGRIEFEITADGKKASASIDEITEKLRKAGTKWEADAKTSTDQIGTSFSGMLTKIATAISAAKIGQALLNIGKDAVQAASDLQEVQNVVDVTFGDAGAAKIEKWAENAGKQFGLTETQAKRFTSTLGAMMKSAGMSGDEIVTMSTDLSGLAADMASFYNLDFDTAFQKIRSGISGETEPLKQLGINMSEANLEAYALQQGLSKTFSEMTQGEKTILRYQYLMNATSDAQGDFANTSTGFANAMRTIETNIESLKTKLGEVLLPVINDVVSGINSMITALTGEHDRTVLDDFADIDLQTAQKIAQINATADTARALTSVLTGIETQIKKNKTDAGTMLDDVPDGSEGNLKTLTDNLAQIEATANAAKTAAGNMDKDIPDGNSSKLSALRSNLNSVSETAKTAQTALGQIEDNMPEDKRSKAEQLKNKLSNIQKAAEEAKKAAEKIDTTDGTGENIEKLQGRFKDISTEIESARTDAKELLSDLPSGQEGNMQTLLANIGTLSAEMDQAKANAGEIKITATANVQDATNALAGLESQAESAESAIEGAADPTETAAEKNALWLETCKELVKTIPGLSSIINTQTGEVKGGTKAVEDYIDAWQKAQTNGVYQWAHEQKGIALQQKEAELAPTELAARVAEYRVKKAQQELNATLQEYGINKTADEMKLFNPNSAYATGNGPNDLGLSSEDAKTLSDMVKNYIELKGAASSATAEYKKQKEAYDEAVEAYKTEGEAIDELAGKGTEGVDEWSQETIDAATAAVAAWEEATQAVEDYIAGVRSATAAQVNSTLSGFKEVKTAAQMMEEAAGDYKTYAEMLGEAAKSQEEWESTVKGSNTQVTVSSMQKALDSQKAYIDEYQANLKTLQEFTDENGNQVISDEILAQLSDGSTESAQYLYAMAQAASSGNISDLQELNKTWQEVNSGKESFTDTLTKQKLTADETYDAMVKKAEEAAKGLDVSETAGTSTGNTIQAIADAIKAKVPELTTQVDAILAQLNRLSGWGIMINLGSFESSTEDGQGTEIASNEKGLDYVPYDGYLSQLHEGEGILTAEENRVWQAFKNGQNGVDYDALGNVISDNAGGGGNVYLNGRLVGSVISDVQGEQYRTLKRSGWQA